MKLYDYQKDFLADRSRMRICAKSRQIGMSTCIALEMVTDALQNPGHLALCVISVRETGAEHPQIRIRPHTAIKAKVQGRDKDKFQAGQWIHSIQPAQQSQHDQGIHGQSRIPGRIRALHR